MKKIILSIGVAFLTISCTKEEATNYNSIQKEEEIITPKKENKEEENNNQPKKEEEKPSEQDPNEGIQKPQDYNMANRMYARLKVDETIFNQNFDYEKFFLKNDLNQLTATYLHQWVNFYSSTPNTSKAYTFTSDDMAQTTLSDIRYNSHDKNISFKVRYKNTSSSQNIIKLPFDIQKYFEHKIQVNPNYFSGKYMLGVYKNLGVFAGSSINEYDSTYYVAVLQENSKVASTNENFIEVPFSILDKREREITTITKRFSGFKPISELKNELIIASSYDLMQYFKRNIKNNTTPEQLKKRFASAIANWIKNAQIYIQRNTRNYELTWGRANVDGGDVASLSAGNSADELDLYFEHPIFSLVSAELRERNLHLRVQLEHINDVSLNDTYFDFVVRNVK